MLRLKVKSIRVSKSVTYFVQCSIYKSVYVGATGCFFYDRVTPRRFSISHNLDTLVAERFPQPGNHMTVSVLQSTQANVVVRILLEKKWIVRIRGCVYY